MARFASGGWSTTGTLITQAPSGRGLTLQSPEPVGHDGDDGATSIYSASVYTVQIDCPDLPSGARALATVTFDVQGQSEVVRVFHVGNGASITGPCDTFNVSVQDDTPEGDAYPSNVEYTILINVTPGVRPPSSAPPVLYGLARELVPPNGMVSVVIPKGCGVTSVFVIASSVIPTDVAQVTVQQTYLEPDEVTVAVLSEYEALRPAGFIPLLGGPDTVTCTNNDAANGVYITLYFGIDG